MLAPANHATCPRATARVIVTLLLACLMICCQSSPEMADGRRVWSAKATGEITGKNFLFVFMPDDWPARMTPEDQETYAAWAGLLETFVKHSGNLSEVRRADFRSASAVFYGRGLPVTEYSLVFVRKDGLALFAHDPIFDGVVYDYADAFLNSKEAEMNWSSLLHAGETEANMPRSLKLLRLQAMPASAAQSSAPALGNTISTAEPPPATPAHIVPPIIVPPTQP